MPLPSPPKRLFVGLMPERAIQAQLQRHCTTWEWPDEARLVPFARYHLTLYFIGEVGAATEQQLRQALREVPMHPLELALGAPEPWPNQVAVLRPAENPGLRALHARIAHAVVDAGLEPELRGYKPHVTLARNAAGAQPPARTEPIRWAAREFALVWSVLPAAGIPARYEVLEWFGAREEPATPEDAAAAAS
ncbi:MAG: RNA 2',3'-cyclic phosphodiesterase [Pseudomonadota bacterium]